MFSRRRSSSEADGNGRRQKSSVIYWLVALAVLSVTTFLVVEVTSLAANENQVKQSRTAEPDPS